MQYAHQSETAVCERTIQAISNINAICFPYKCMTLLCSIELILFYTGSPYVRPISAIKAVAGDSFTIHCPFSGYPIDQIRWEKSGQELVSSKLIPPIETFALCISRM